MSKINDLDDLNDLRSDISLHIKAIRSSSQWYRSAAKEQKISVLEACKDYLDGKIDKVKLEETIKNNPNFSDSILRSSTKSLVKNVLNISDALIEDRKEFIGDGKMSKEGYVGGNFNP